MTDLVKLGPAVLRDEDRREPVGPGVRAGRVGDEVLADLDEGMGEPAPGPVAIEAVVLERPVIGLVVADDEVGIAGERRDQGERETRIGVPQEAGVPGPRPAAPDRRERMDRDQRRRPVARDRSIAAPMAA